MGEGKGGEGTRKIILLEPLFTFQSVISNLRLTSASVDFRDMSRSLRSVKNTLIFEHFPLFRVFHLNCYLSYLQFLKLTYISFLYHCI